MTEESTPTSESDLMTKEIELDQTQYRIFEYVTPEHLEDLNNELNYNLESENYEDGADSVLGKTTEMTEVLKKNIHSNLQGVDTFWRKIACPQWNDYVCQLSNSSPQFTVTREGGYYRAHFDHPQNGHFSNTLFLNDPDEYEGGELELLINGELKRFKLPAGQIVTYETGVPHQVRTVTKGVRKVLIWWTHSVIPKKSDLYAWRTLKQLAYIESKARAEADGKSSGPFTAYPATSADVTDDLYEFVQKPHCIYHQACNNILRNHLYHRTGITGI